MQVHHRLEFLFDRNPRTACRASITTTTNDNIDLLRWSDHIFRQISNDKTERLRQICRRHLAREQRLCILSLCSEAFSLVACHAHLKTKDCRRRMEKSFSIEKKKSSKKKGTRQRQMATCHQEKSIRKWHIEAEREERRKKRSVSGGFFSSVCLSACPSLSLSLSRSRFFRCSSWFNVCACMCR